MLVTTKLRKYRPYSNCKDLQASVQAMRILLDYSGVQK